MSIAVDLKAKELVEKFKQSIALHVPVYVDWLKEENEWLNTAKECALIAVDEIIAALDLIELMERGKVVGGLGQDDYLELKEKIKTL